MPFNIKPNIIVIVLGIESFQYTCAPMFGHYIDEETDFYLLEFEGVNDNRKNDLKDYYGKNEILFIRHFFCKFYGSNTQITPYSSWLEDSPEDFSNRMLVFF